MRKMCAKNVVAGVNIEPCLVLEYVLVDAIQKQGPQNEHNLKCLRKKVTLSVFLGQGGVSSQRRTSNSPHKVDNSRTGMTPNFSKNPQSVQHEDVNTVLLPSVSEKCSKSPMSCSTHAPPEPRAAAFAIAEDVVIETEARTDSSGVNARRGTPNRGQVPRKKSLFAQRFDAAKKQATNVGDVSSTFTSTTAGHSQPVTASTASTGIDGVIDVMHCMQALQFVDITRKQGICQV